MVTHPQLDEIGRLVGDPSRAAILAALMDGRAWTGRELATFANVTPSTASSHLGRLVRGSLVSVIAQGRHCYYRIAGPEMAQALESLMTLAPKTTPRHPVQRRIAEDLVGARFCYDHLAGKLGVAIADSLVARGAIELRDATANVTAEGTQLFRHIGIAPKPCRPCLDWSERRPHLAGPLAAALAKLAMDRHWVVRKSGTRAVTVTALGRTALREIFEVSVAAEAS